MTEEEKKAVFFEGWQFDDHLPDGTECVFCEDAGVPIIYVDDNFGFQRYTLREVEFLSDGIVACRYHSDDEEMDAYLVRKVIL